MQGKKRRTTIYLDKELFIAAKKRAIDERTTLTELVKRGLRAQLKKNSV